MLRLDEYDKRGGLLLFKEVKQFKLASRKKVGVSGSCGLSTHRTSSARQHLTSRYHGLSRFLMHDSCRGLEASKVRIVGTGSTGTYVGTRKRRSHLMVRKDERVSDYHILPSSGIEYHNLRDVIRRQGLTAAVTLLALHFQHDKHTHA